MASSPFAGVLLAILTCMASSAFAQNHPPGDGSDQKNEIGGFIGRTYVSDHHVVGLSFNNVLTSGPGLSFQINYGRKLAEWDVASLTVEVPVMFDLDQDENLVTNLVPGDYSAIFVTPSLRANFFPQTAISPWISVGGGFGHFSLSPHLEFGGPNPGPTGDTTGVAQFGAGLDVPFFWHLTLRGEVRDFYSGVTPLNVNTGMGCQHNLFAGGGFLWRF